MVFTVKTATADRLQNWRTGFLLDILLKIHSVLYFLFSFYLIGGHNVEPLMPIL